jgi:hypothetical protein
MGKLQVLDGLACNFMCCKFEMPTFELIRLTNQLLIIKPGQCKNQLVASRHSIIAKV